MSSPAVARAVAILDELAAARGSALTLSELARRLHIAKSSVSGICQELETGGLIRTGPAGYRLGCRLAELGDAFRSSFDPVREFYTACEADEVLRAENVQLATRHDREVAYLAKHDGISPITFSARVGDRLPASTTAVGRALLQSLSESAVAELYADSEPLPKRTSRSITELPTLLSELRDTRENGAAIDDRGTFEHVVGIAVLIPFTPVSGKADRAQTKPLALGVSILAGQATVGRRREVTAALKRVALRLGGSTAEI